MQSCVGICFCRGNHCGCAALHQLASAGAQSVIRGIVPEIPLGDGDPQFVSQPLDAGLLRCGGRVLASQKRPWRCFLACNSDVCFSSAGLPRGTLSNRRVLLPGSGIAVFGGGLEMETSRRSLAAALGPSARHANTQVVVLLVDCGT